MADLDTAGGSEPDLSPSEDLRSSIESAIETHEGPPEVPEGSVKPESTPLSEKAAASAKGDRDAFGRFLPKEKGQEAQEAPQAAPGTPGATPPVQGQPAPIQAAPQAGVYNPPQSWSPLAREHWKAMPPAAQAEVVRREQEMQRYVNEMAPARSIAERFTQTIQPYLGVIQAEGVDPLTAVRNLMSVTQTMRQGTQYEKAQMLANVIKVYGVDVKTLDDALMGVLPAGGQQPQGADPQYVQSLVQQQLAPLYQMAQQRQQQIAQVADGEARSELEVFAQDPKNEFFEDLRGEMADIIELGEKYGRDITLQQAYERAAMLHPEVSKVMLARQQGVNARSLTAAAQRAKGAAVSVRGSAPVGNPNPSEPTSIRESIEAAIQAHS